VLRFARQLIAFREHHPILRTDAFFDGEELEGFGPEGRPPDWDGPTSALGCLVREQRPAAALCLLFNASETPVEFCLPPAPPARWHLSIDTGNTAPGDIFPVGDERPLHDSGRYRLLSCALAVLSSS
jgi:isoamylase